MTIARPIVTINLLPANEEVSTGPQRVLVVGQMLTGTATAGQLVEDIGNDKSWDTLFGAKSMMAGMCRSFRDLNKVTRLDALPLADGAGVKATGVVTFSGTATANGTLYVTIGSYANYRVELPVATGDTAADLATDLLTAITAMSNAPFTAAVSTGAVTITYSHNGLEGNFQNLRYEGGVPGITVALTAFANGTVNPTLTGIFDAVADERYQTVVWPTSYTRSEVLTNFLDKRFNVNNIILDGVAIQTVVDTRANLKTTAAALNSQSSVLVGVKSVSETAWKGNALQEMPHLISTQIAALRSLRLTEGSNIARYVTTTTGSLDSIGGPALASLPYFNTPLDNLQLIPVGKGFSPAEIEELVKAGISTIGNNRSNNKVVLGDLVTTYKTDNAGNEDVTFSYLNNVDVASTVREYFSNNIRKQYAQSRLTEGDLVPNRSIANKDSIGAYMDKLFLDLSGTDFVLLQRGEEARRFFKDNRTIYLDIKNGRVTIAMQVPIVTQLRELIVAMEIAFSTTS